MNEPKVRTCRKCGCTDDKACMTLGGPCWWAEIDLCSACVPVEKRKDRNLERINS